MVIMPSGLLFFAVLWTKFDGKKDYIVETITPAELKKAMLICFAAFCFTCQSTWILACDACGININQTSSNLLLGHQNHILLFTYQKSGFTTTSDHGHFSKDDFTTVDVFVKFRINDKWFLSGSMDYKINERVNDYREHSELKGVGDLRLSVGYRWLQKKTEDKSLYSVFETTTGVTLPTGKHDKNLTDRNLPENFNLGSGSIGFFGQSAFFVSKGHFGLSTFASYFMYTESPGGYDLGDRFISSLSFQYEKQFGGLIIVPNIGVHYEQIGKDHFANGNEAAESSGRGLHGKLGLATLVNGLQIGGKLQFPIAQQYISGDVQSHNRVFFDLTYFF